MSVEEAIKWMQDQCGAYMTVSGFDGSYGEGWAIRIRYPRGLVHYELTRDYYDSLEAAVAAVIAREDDVNMGGSL